LAVYAGNALASLREMQCGRFVTEGTLTFHADAGTTYYPQVDGHGGLPGAKSGKFTGREWP
jgi:hypothetical protein